METKQVIVMRKDLNMRKGKMIAQGAHASLKVFFDRMSQRDGNYTIPEHKVTEAMEHWMTNAFTKICVYVNSEQELLDIYNKAKCRDIPCALIRDAGHTEFNGVPTLTCCAIGPDYEEKINPITGDLKLL